VKRTLKPFLTDRTSDRKARVSGIGRTLVSRETESSVPSPIVTPRAKIYVPRETNSEAVPHGLYSVAEKLVYLELVGLSFHVKYEIAQVVSPTFFNFAHELL
jgi:hypothetical protein